MKKYLLALIALSSCGDLDINNNKHLKPFIITSKNDFIFFKESKTGTCTYWYRDGRGNNESFVELQSKYNIGDTIK